MWAQARLYAVARVDDLALKLVRRGADLHAIALGPGADERAAIEEIHRRLYGREPRLLSYEDLDRVDCGRPGDYVVYRVFRGASVHHVIAAKA